MAAPANASVITELLNPSVATALAAAIDAAAALSPAGSERAFRALPGKTFSDGAQVTMPFITYDIATTGEGEFTTKDGGEPSGRIVVVITSAGPNQRGAIAKEVEDRMTASNLSATGFTLAYVRKRDLDTPRTETTDPPRFHLTQVYRFAAFST